MSDIAAGVDRSKLKISIIASVLGAAGVWLGFSLRALLAGSGSAVAAALAAVVFAAMLALLSAFVKSAFVYGIVLLGVTALLMAPLYRSYTVPLLVTAVVAYLFMLAGGRRGQASAANDMKMSAARITRAMFPLAFSGIAVIIAVLHVQPLLNEDFRVTKLGVLRTFAPAEFILRRFIGEFSLSMPVGKLIDMVANSGASGARSGLPQEARGAIVGQLGGALGVPIGERSSVADVLVEVLDREVRKVPATWHTAIVAAFGALLFFTVKGIGFFAYYPVALLVWGLYELALATGFARVVLEQKSKETIVL
ncbi:MAG: hypothetical protein HYZ07_00725 [Candidatus Harrisonbacteria bacterium]|nr:hypothetical protein [Candidatus Harrisonbacteria bacterium]